MALAPWDDSTKEFKVVLVGAGHTNTQIMKKITRQTTPAHIRLTLISDNEISFYSGMVPGCIAGFYTPQQVGIMIAPLCEISGWEFIQKAVIGVSSKERRLLLDGGHSVSYDIVVFDVGSRSPGHDVEGVAQFAISTRPLSRLLVKVAELERKYHKKTNDVNIVVIGGGAAGCELAMGIQSRMSSILSVPARTFVTIITKSSSVLSGECNAVIKLTEKTLAGKDIRVKTISIVAKVEEGIVELESGERIVCDEVIWATGAAAHAFMDRSCPSNDLNRDSRGFLLVNEFLQSPENNHVFGAGDCIHFVPTGGLTKAGVYAVREGPILIDNVTATLKRKPLQSFKPQQQFLKLLMCGDGSAIGTKFGVAFKGRWVWALKDWIDTTWMKLFSNKAELTNGPPCRS